MGRRCNFIKKEKIKVITNLTRTNLPNLSAKEIKNKILGRKYDLSIVFVGDTRSKTLNKKYRKKDYPTNVLSFPISKDLGEIYINIPYAKKDCKNFELSFKNYLKFMIIHGSLHLNGYSHGEKMYNEEKQLLKFFIK